MKFVLTKKCCQYIYIYIYIYIYKIFEISLNFFHKAEGNSDTNCSSCIWNVPQSTGKRIGSIKNQRKNQDHADYNIQTG